MKIILFILCFYTAAANAVARDNSLVEHIADLPQLQNIAKEKTWRQLLAYGSADKSSISTPKFFLSEAGATNPYMELIATLNAFAEKKTLKDQHAQCLFRGRYVWLSKQINFEQLGIYPVDCPEYLAFTHQNQAESISIIFATGYLGNPASYYGHLLLKINSPLQSKTSDLESTSINFGANVPLNENMLLYIAKGIFGGYNSSFTQQQFFYHAHNYGESELRDLWEYELALDKENLDLVIAHVWEILNADYTYYFFNRNCAFRMGELLELVSDQSLVNNWRLWETPQEIVQKLGDLSYHNKPLVKKIIYHPSRQSRLYQRYAGTKPQERKIIHDIVSNPDHLKSHRLQTLSLEQQYKIIDTLIDYYQFIRKEKEGAKDPNNELYRQVLSERYALPPGESLQLFSSINQPHLGRKPSYLNMGLIYNNNLPSPTSVIWLRPAYYDSLDAGYGHIKNASLSMGELSVAINKNELYIREFNAIKIESLRRNFTGLPADRHSSWYLEVGAEQTHISCTDCLGAKARAGYGYAASEWDEKLVVAGFIGGGFIGETIDGNGLYVSAKTTLNLNLSNILSVRMEAERRHFKQTQDYSVFSTQARVQLSTQSDLRFFVAQNRDHEIGLSMGYYW